MDSNAISGTIGAIHGELRWIFVLVALIGIIRSIYGVIRDTQFSALDNRLALAYSILLDVQALYGIGLIIYLGLSKLGSFEATFNWIGWHPAWMLAAVVVGHLGSRWKEAPDETRFQVRLGVYVVSLILITIGVFASPLNGWA